MSGGHFDYKQYRIEDIAEEIDNLIASNDERSREYKPETIERFRQTAHVLRQAAEMAQRVDLLVSFDDGEDCFHDRWKDEVRDDYNPTTSVGG